MDAVLATFSFYAIVVILKMVLMSFLTSFHRLRIGIFSNPEDAAGYGVVSFSNAQVERVRRAHLNDMENIIPFVLIGVLYCSTGPKLATAKLLFQVFAGSRIVHTIAYLLAIPQPTRVLAFLAGAAVNVFMAYHVLTATAGYM